MAKYAVAAGLKDEAEGVLSGKLGMELRGIGLVQQSPGDYGFKVILPRRPSVPPPPEVVGVPVEYAVLLDEPVALAGKSKGWRSRAR